MDTPVNLLRSHRPALTEASACATFRDSAQMSAMPCSAAATVLAVGAFTTRQPFCAAHAHAGERVSPRTLDGWLPGHARMYV